MSRILFAIFFESNYLQVTFAVLVSYEPGLSLAYRGILADVIVYIFAHLHRALPTEGKVLDRK